MYAIIFLMGEKKMSNTYDYTESNDCFPKTIIDEENGLKIEIDKDGNGTLVDAGLVEGRKDECVVPGYVKVIRGGAFSGTNCYSNIILSPGVQIIESEAFAEAYLVGKLVIPSTVSYIGKDAFDFEGGSDVTIEIDPDNPYYVSDRVALYTKDFHSLIYFYDQNEGGCRVKEATKVICTGAFSNNNLELRDIDILSPSIVIEKDAFSSENFFNDAYNRLGTIRIHGKIESMESQSGFNDSCDLLEIYVNAMSPEEFEEKGLMDFFPDASIFYFNDDISLSKTYKGGIRYSFDYEKNEATACAVQRYYENPYLSILPEINGMPVTKISNYFLRLELSDEFLLLGWPNDDRWDREHDRIIYVPKSIKTIEDKAFSKSTFPVSRIAATEFTKEEWYDRFGSGFSANIIFKDNPACVDYFDEEDIRCYDFWCEDGCIIRNDGTLMYYPRTPNYSICRIPSGVVAIDPYAFYDNEYIEKLVLPDTLMWYPDLTKMKNLKEIVVSDTATGFSVIDGVLFSKDGNKLISYPIKKEGKVYHVPNSVKEIWVKAFPKKCSIEQLFLPSSVTSFPLSLWNLKKIQNVTIEDGNSSWITIDGVLFNRDCTVLVKYPSNKPDFSYRIPDSVLEISEDAFADCRFLKKLTYSVSIDRELYNVSGLREVECVRIEENSFYSIIDGVIFNKEKTKLIKYPSSKEEKTYIIPECVEEIDEEAFPEYLLYLKRIVIPSHWKSIPQCLLRKRIIIEVPENNPYFQTVDGVIFNKEKTKLIKYPYSKEEETYIIPEGVEEIDEEAFLGYIHELKRIVIPSHWQNIPQWLMKKWISIEVPENNPYFMTIDGVIYSKDKRKLIRYSRKEKEDIFTIPECVEEIDEEAFSGDIRELKRIVIPSHWKSIPQCLLKERIIEVPENNPYLMTIDGVIYSKDKRKLISYSKKKKERSFTIPEEVEEIGSYAFAHCCYLNDVTISKKVNMIQDNTFYWCSKLRNVLFLSEDTIIIQPDGFVGCSKVHCFAENSPDLRQL